MKNGLFGLESEFGDGRGGGSDSRSQSLLLGQTERDGQGKILCQRQTWTGQLRLSQVCDKFLYLFVYGRFVRIATWTTCQSRSTIARTVSSSS